MKNKYSNRRGKNTVPQEIQHVLLEVLSQKGRHTQRIKSLLRKASSLGNGPCHEEAIELIKELLSNQKLFSKERVAYLWYLKGFSYHAKCKYQEALKNYNVAILINPDGEGMYYFDRGRLREEMGNKEGMESDFEKGRKICPELFDKSEDN